MYDKYYKRFIFIVCISFFQIGSYDFIECLLENDIGNNNLKWNFVVSLSARFSELNGIDKVLFCLYN